MDNSDTAVSNLDTAKRVKKDYDSYLNLFDEKEVETTLQVCSLSFMYYFQYLLYYLWGLKRFK